MVVTSVGRKSRSDVISCLLPKLGNQHRSNVACNSIYQIMTLLSHIVIEVHREICTLRSTNYAFRYANAYRLAATLHLPLLVGLELTKHIYETGTD